MTGVSHSAGGKLPDRQSSRMADSLATAAWDETQHPRSPNGQFGTGGDAPKAGDTVTTPKGEKAVVEVVVPFGRIKGSEIKNVEGRPSNKRSGVDDKVMMVNQEHSGRTMVHEAHFVGQSRRQGDFSLREQAANALVDLNGLRLSPPVASAENHGHHTKMADQMAQKYEAARAAGNHVAQEQFHKAMLGHQQLARDTKPAAFALTEKDRQSTRALRAALKENEKPSLPAGRYKGYERNTERVAPSVTSGHGNNMVGVHGATEFKKLPPEFKNWLQNNHEEYADKASWHSVGYNDRQDLIDEYNKGVKT